MPLSGAALLAVPPQVITTWVTCALVAFVVGAVFGPRRRRYPVVVTIFVVVLVFVTALVLIGVEPFIAVALVGTAAAATVRLSPRVREV